MYEHHDNINNKIKEFFSPTETLYFSSKVNDIEKVNDLINNGWNPFPLLGYIYKQKIDINQLWRGRSALSIASANGHIEIVELFLNHLLINININDYSGITPLCYATLNDNINIINLLLEHGADVYGNSNGKTPLFYSIRSNSLNMMKFWLNKSINPNIKDNQGNTVLHELIYDNKYHMIELLSEYNLDVNIKNNLGQTALIIACWNDYIESIEILLKLNCDINISDNDDNTALSITKDKNNSTIIQLLQEYSNSEKIDEKN